MELKLPTCPVCGGEAAVALRSIREVEPQKDDDGREWATWENVGDIIAWCASHRPDDPMKRGTATYRDGRVVSLEQHLEEAKKG